MVCVKRCKCFLDPQLTHLGVVDSSVSISRSNAFEAGLSFVVYLFSFEPQDILSHSSRSNLTPWHSFWLRYRPWVCLEVLISAVFCSRHSELVCFHIAEKLMVASVEKDLVPLTVNWTRLFDLDALLKNILCLPTLRISANACTTGLTHFYSTTIYWAPWRLHHGPCPSYRDDNLVGTPENLCSIGTLLLPKQFVCVTPCSCFTKQF